MAEIVNLKNVRKGQARAADAAKAAQNRVTHGRTKAEKKLAKAEAEQARKKLDAHKREE